MFGKQRAGIHHVLSFTRDTEEKEGHTRLLFPDPRVRGLFDGPHLSKKPATVPGVGGVLVVNHC